MATARPPLLSVLPISSVDAGSISRLDLWDTAGQERYHSLAPMHYRGAAAAVVVCDISGTDSCIRAKKWVDELQRQGSVGVHNGLFFVETSAKTTQNISELFYELAEGLVKVQRFCCSG